MKSIGFDFGSVCTKAVLLGANGVVELAVSRRKISGGAAVVDDILDEIAAGFPDERFRLGTTAPSQTAVAGRGMVSSNPLLAIATGIGGLHPTARSVIEIGGHTSKLIAFREDGTIADFATNEACAAGTGSFLEQQAKRMALSVEQLATLAAEAKSAATIAGRCSVFAKSDMIHLQQKGTPVGEIAYGLCMAICRNALATLLKGREIAPPVVIAGGCANNGGVLRAFRETLGTEIIVSSRPGFEAAIGVASKAARSDLPELSIGEVRRILQSVLSEPSSPARLLPPLRKPTTAVRFAEPEAVHDRVVDAWLGVDVGSVSTDLVLLDGKGDLLSSVYLATRGRPVDVLLEGLAILRSRFPAGLRIAGCGATGSGRHLAARILGADAVKNEITAQMLGARRFVPDVDTVFEIGGQDSKFISLSHGAIADFAMNKICAAGTGSFLEEQAREMAIDIEHDFAPPALLCRTSAPASPIRSSTTTWRRSSARGHSAARSSFREEWPRTMPSWRRSKWSPDERSTCILTTGCPARSAPHWRRSTRQPINGRRASGSSTRPTNRRCAPLSAGTARTDAK
jgi:predicted CoA-substrate-specific enzyme activase